MRFWRKHHQARSGSPYRGEIMTLREDTLGVSAKRRAGSKVAVVSEGEKVEYLYLSADNHMDVTWYPKDIIQSRIAAKYRADAPKVMETDVGTQWFWEGEPRAFAADGKDWPKYAKRFAPVDVPEGALPPTDPKVLLQHMDIGKMYAGVFYGNTRKWTFKDKELEKAVYSAFNDWAVEVCSYAPDRIIALPWLHAQFPETCAAELRRLVDLGVRAVEFSFADADVVAPLWDPIWEPLWTAAAETNTVICAHIGDAAGTPYPINEYGQSLAHFSQVPFNPVGKFIAQVVFNGMFERHPSLKVSVAECRIGWLPFLFQWMDRAYADRVPDSKYQLKNKPTDLIREHMTFTFEEDYIGAKMLRDPEYVIGDVAIWGADYPHEQGQTWPDAGPAMDKMFDGADPKLKHEVVWGRTQRLFGIKGPGSA
jgi:predicted TIM-barrel fold metal-dependent hydrolase